MKKQSRGEFVWCSMISYHISETTIEESEVEGDDLDETLTTDLVESTDHLIPHRLATQGDQIWT